MNVLRGRAWPVIGAAGSLAGVVVVVLLLRGDHADTAPHSTYEGATTYESATTHEDSSAQTREMEPKTSQKLHRPLRLTSAPKNEETEQERIRRALSNPDTPVVRQVFTPQSLDPLAAIEATDVERAKAEQVERDFNDEIKTVMRLHKGDMEAIGQAYGDARKTKMDGYAKIFGEDRAAILYRVQMDNAEDLVESLEMLTPEEREELVRSQGL